MTGRKVTMLICCCCTTRLHICCKVMLQLLHLADKCKPRIFLAACCCKHPLLIVYSYCRQQVITVKFVRRARAAAGHLSAET